MPTHAIPSDIRILQLSSGFRANRCPPGGWGKRQKETPAEQQSMPGLEINVSLVHSNILPKAKTGFTDPSQPIIGKDSPFSYNQINRVEQTSSNYPPVIRVSKCILVYQDIFFHNVTENVNAKKRDFFSINNCLSQLLLGMNLDINTSP